MIIDREMNTEELMCLVRAGQKSFYRIDFGEGSLAGSELNDIVFEECFLMIDFSGADLLNSKFINSNIKCCTFINSNLSNATITGCAVECVDLRGAKIEGLSFKDNYCYGSVLQQEDIDMLIEISSR